MTAKDVGELLMITLKNDGGGYKSDWFVNRVTIKDKAKNHTYDFPCNRWVQDETIAFEGKGKIAVSNLTTIPFLVRVNWIFVACELRQYNSADQKEESDRKITTSSSVVLLANQVRRLSSCSRGSGVRLQTWRRMRARYTSHVNDYD